MKKILVSISTVVIVAIVAVTATRAYFSDTETSTGNTFTAGTVNLALSKGSGYSDEWTGPIQTFSNMAPGVASAPFKVWFKNIGTIAGVMNVTVSGATENDAINQTGKYASIGEGDANDVGPVTFSKHVMVVDSRVSYKSDYNNAGWLAQQIIDDAYASSTDSALNDGAIIGYDLNDTYGAPDYVATVYGLSKININFTESYKGADVVLNPGDEVWEEMQLMLDPNVGNAYQYDGINISITALLKQAH